MRRTALTIAAASATILGLAACDPNATSTSTSKDTAPAAAGSPAATQAAPAAAGGGEAAKDVEITKCSINDLLKMPEAEVKITNHSSKSSNYIVQIEFTDASGTRVAESAAATNNLAPNQSAVQKAPGSAQVNGKVSCKVTNVTRYAAP
ncbi:FxLYD domain-containing protein [Kitasatospora sp. NPDC088556]|uniref:FxLYD domain-containing protein n=1 Tax=Kitasatospora sp. NPDC088556 TaxID=3364076 RepID=UPI0037F4D9DA